MKVLVLAERYAKDREYALLYIHSRNIEYIQKGVEVVVLNFSEKHSYEIDGISVFGEATLESKHPLESFDLILSHAPNLRNHFRFILSKLSKIKKIVFFIHGHEVLIKDKYYPPPFDYEQKRILKNIVHWCYDRIKVRLLKMLFKYLQKRTLMHFVFVSEWMEEQFYKCLRLKPEQFCGQTSIIHNPVNSAFLKRSYSPQELEGDFISIRPFDGPKYCVDLIWKLARANPDFKFTLYGKGSFFKYHAPPPNLTVREHYLNQSEIPEILNKYRAAIMLTRLDSQGVMACEMAAYGIPLITSDIPVKRQLLGDIRNVAFMPNDLSKPLKEIKLATGVDPKMIEKFSNENTLTREIDLFKQL